ncbi:hypothetical protein GGR06_002244 [Bacteroides reticulotermitis]|uniref:Uncharacterized protein n=1 Tax=Bacteroides reticulotermitis TaxID=1133319 RepID=A0A840CX48_9BACE|nr:hypothetical protein [Bacteroides reticulotermitis]
MIIVTFCRKQLIDTLIQCAYFSETNPFHRYDPISKSCVLYPNTPAVSRKRLKEDAKQGLSDPHKLTTHLDKPNVRATTEKVSEYFAYFPFNIYLCY